MDKRVERRSLLRAAGAVAVAASPFPFLFQRCQRPGGAAPDSRRLSGLLHDARGVLDLPEGFSYSILERAFQPMTDGYRVPARPDGMACFSGADGRLVLMRNHEIDSAAWQGPFPGEIPNEVYDREAFGCVTRLVVDPKTLERVSSNLVLAGTLRNCAGGPSPWGWLSCEESVEPRHGYVFRCATDADRLRPPSRIAAYGRFNHEAVCIDPVTQAAYLTEDRPDGCLYRFRPRDPEAPFVGTLEAMRVRDQPGYEIASLLAPGMSLPIDWVEIPKPDSENDDARHQAQERGAALVRRGEGIWFFEGDVYVCSTSGGPANSGQVLRVTTPATGAERLELVAHSTDPEALDCPDNITVAPWGDLFVAEDGAGTQCVRGIKRDGRIFDVARNAQSSGEFAGLCFSPDGSALFMNLQGDGITLVVRGPFRELGA